MALFPEPYVADVQDEVKLRPEQVRATFSDADYSADVAGRIVEEAAYVEARLQSRFSAGSLAALTESESTLGTSIIELRAAAALYHSAGQLNEKYHDEALNYERRANELLDALLASVNSRESALNPTNTFSRTLRRSDGYSASATEYARGD